MSLGYYRALMNQASGVSFLLDEYTTNMPCYWLSKQISSDMSGDIVLAEEMTGNTTQGFAFESDGSFPTSSIESFASGGDVRIRRLYEATGSGKYFDYGTGTQCPLIVASGSIITDDNSRVALRFTGSEYGSVSSSTADYNEYTNGTTSTALTSIKTETATSFTHAYGSFYSSGQRGFRFTHRTNYIRMQIDYGGGYIVDSGGTAPSAVGQTDVVFMKIDSDNATANERIYINIDGSEYNNNTATRAGGSLSATNDCSMGANLTGSSGYKGLMNGWISWDSDEYSNRTDILTYL